MVFKQSKRKMTHFDIQIWNVVLFGWSFSKICRSESENGALLLKNIVRYENDVRLGKKSLLKEWKQLVWKIRSIK